MTSVGSMIGHQHGEAVTYNTKDAAGDTTDTTAISEAAVTPRREYSYTDDDGRVYARVIEALIQKAEFAGPPQENDTITWAAEEWLIKQIRDGAASWLIIAVRHEKKETTGPEYRRTRRMAGEEVQ